MSEIFENFSQALGEMSGIRPRNWRAEKQRFAETKEEELLAVTGVTYAVVEKREGHEAATLEVKRFLHDIAHREGVDGALDMQSVIAGKLLNMAYESPEELESLIISSQQPKDSQ